MAKGPTDQVISHWHKLIDDLEASPMKFYEAVEQAIQARKIPDASTSRVEWKEGGVLSARREYLRVTRGKLSFDICGAPFGRGFFFSSWLTDQVPSRALLAVIAVLVVAIAAMKALSGDVESATKLLAVFVAVVVVGWLLMRGLVGAVFGGSEEKVLSIPVIGQVYEMLFKPHSYYKIDTALMFQAAVHAAVLEVIDGITEEKGLRALSELDRRPVMKDFLARQ